MDRRERLLYHQIHPLKLAIDCSSGTLSYCLLWQHRLRPALAVQMLPAPLVSLALVRWADLKPYRESRFGRYVGRHMTPGMQAVRLIGNIVISVAAWYRRPWLLVAGVLVVLFGWGKGRLLG
ncbi:MAG TPA: hypothetical protein VMU89_11635 [Thermomicrobiaceae bacterium]|nr:hypothetical protein [Thermomicrobiaceae bacterium]